MSNLLLLAVCFVAGMLLRRTSLLPQNAHLTLNAFVTNLSLPALTLAYVPRIPLDQPLVYPVAMAWLLFGMGVLFFLAVGRWLQLTRATTGGLMLSGGLANTSFVGLPMIEAYFGAGSMAIGILIDQLGTYLVLSTLGIWIACLCSAGKPEWRSIARKIATFPPFIALLIALALVPYRYPAWLEEMLMRLGDTLAPVALVSVGYQLRLANFREHARPLAIGLGFKLVLGPLLLVALYVGVFGASGEVVQVTLFEAAMGPMIGGAIVAMQHGLNPPLITLMVGLGLPLSFITLAAWWRVLQFF